MKYIWIAALVVMLGGCSTLASKETTAVCQAADTLTTLAVINAGGSEANPLLANVISKWGTGGFIVFKLVITAFLLAIHDDVPKEVNATINGVTCGAAVWNTSLL